MDTESNAASSAPAGLDRGVNMFAKYFKDQASANDAAGAGNQPETPVAPPAESVVTGENTDAQGTPGAGNEGAGVPDAQPAGDAGAGAPATPTSLREYLASNPAAAAELNASYRAQQETAARAAAMRQQQEAHQQWVNSLSDEEYGQWQRQQAQLQPVVEGARSDGYGRGSVEAIRDALTTVMQSDLYKGLSADAKKRFDPNTARAGEFKNLAHYMQEMVSTATTEQVEKEVAKRLKQTNQAQTTAASAGRQAPPVVSGPVGTVTDEWSPTKFNSGRDAMADLLARREAARAAS